MANAYEVNDRIFARMVRVIDENGEQKGVMSTRDALAYARSVDLDLVKVADARPHPVCRVVDANKFIYSEKKAKEEAEKRQRATNSVLKEVQLRPTIDTNDLAIKARKANEFLENSDKVKVVMRFRGREVTHKDIGREKMKKFVELLKGFKIERAQSETHNEIMVILAPLVSKAQAAQSTEVAKAA